MNAARHPVKVTLLHAFAHRPSIYGEYTGSMQRLANGDALVNWGYIPEITQFSPTGKVLMDLSLSHPSYRGFRFPWVGRPSSAPSAAAKSRNGGLKVWASWNGATQVAAWRVLGGTVPVHLTARESGGS